MEGILWALIHIAVAALIVWLVLYVLGEVGVPLPAQVVKIIWIIFGLLCLIYLLRAVVPLMGGRLLAIGLPFLSGA